jgi:hypothetical protein
MDADGSGTIDFSEWLNWGAQDGTALLERIRQEKGISEEQLRDPGAEMPCGEERLRTIEASMRQSGEIACGAERRNMNRERFGGPSCGR